MHRIRSFTQRISRAGRHAIAGLQIAAGEFIFSWILCQAIVRDAWSPDVLSITLSNIQVVLIILALFCIALVVLGRGQDDADPELNWFVCLSWGTLLLQGSVYMIMRVSISRALHLASLAMAAGDQFTALVAAALGVGLSFILLFRWCTQPLEPDDD